MSSRRGLTAASLNPDLDFNWAIFFVFYFNRLFATLVSYGIRSWTWYKYGVFVEFQSLQISLLAGRVFFKSLRYHGDNQTVLVHSGYITWNYWLRKVRDVDVYHATQRYPPSEGTDGGSDAEDDDMDNLEVVDQASMLRNEKLPCRITINLEGLEWFVYNSSIAYDALLVRLQQAAETPELDVEVTKDSSHDVVASTASGKPALRGGSPISLDVPFECGRNSELPDLEAKAPDRQSALSGNMKQATDHGNLQSSQPLEELDSLVLRLLPVHVSCSKAAVVIGNQHTKSVLIVKSDTLTGKVNAALAPHLDQYKQVFDVSFGHPVVQIKPNDDYRDTQKDSAIRLKEEMVLPDPLVRRNLRIGSYLHRQRHRLMHGIRSLLPMLQGSVESVTADDRGEKYSTRLGQAPHDWHGLSRYLDDDEQLEDSKWLPIEYAMVTTILDCPEAHLLLYWDVAGRVNRDGSQPCDEASGLRAINGEQAPEYGVDLSFKNATVNYGPWADRQRANLQEVFFPALCKDNLPTQVLPDGAYRIPTQFKLNAEFEGETVLRMPCRETSKNWLWTKHADAMADRQAGKAMQAGKGKKSKLDKGPGPEIRSFGWIDIKVPSFASVRYTMDLLASSRGFANDLVLDLPNAEISTSVNHSALWKSRQNRVLCDLSNPLRWNGQRSWTFGIESEGLELFLLREHIFLLNDLTEDWASGPAPDYQTFAPYLYALNIVLDDFKLYLNVNDANIINRPTDPDDNTFLIFHGQRLESQVSIPMDRYCAQLNEIDFSVDVESCRLSLNVPPWNTQAAFLESMDLGQLKALQVKGEYHYYADRHPSNTDTLILDIYGNAPMCHLYGFVIRYFIKIADNYFGTDIHFKTLEEYQQTRRASEPSAPAQSKANDLDVQVSISAHASTAILPTNLYSAVEQISVEIDSLSADLRVTNYYMDLDLVLHTLMFSQVHEQHKSASPTRSTSSTQVYIDGIEVYGSRLFGLPPLEPTYVCNWDFNVGTIEGECDATFLGHLTRAVQALTFSLDDDENTLPIGVMDLPHDVTLLRAAFSSARIWMHADGVAVLLSIGHSRFAFNDWARTTWSSQVDLSCQSVEAALVDADSASRQRTRPQSLVDTHGMVRTSLMLTMRMRKANADADRLLQQEHVHRHDQRTQRTQFLLDTTLTHRFAETTFNIPAMCTAAMPEPIGRSFGRTSVPAGGAKTTYDGKYDSVNHTRSFEEAHPRAYAYQSAHTSLENAAHDLEGFHNDAQTNADVTTSGGVVFSSSYMAPHFPLLEVRPDSRHLPTLETAATEPLTAHVPAESTLTAMGARYESVKHTSILVDFGKGVSVMVKPSLATLAISVSRILQPRRPLDILDALQFGTIGPVVDAIKEEARVGHVLDVGARIDLFRVFVSTGQLPGMIEPGSGHDEYSLRTNGLALNLRQRSETDTGNTATAKSLTSIHCMFDKATLRAGEYCQASGTQIGPALDVHVEQLVMWATTGSRVAGNLTQGRTELKIDSRNVGYLATLISRTNTLIAQTKQSIDGYTSHKADRLQLLIYLIAVMGQDVTEPLFLTRPAYVLRRASNHLRTHDSWRTLSRLRATLYDMDPASYDEISRRCAQSDPSLPTNIMDLTMQLFDRGRSWEWQNIKSSSVWAHIYDAVTQEVVGRAIDFHQMEIAVRVKLVKLLVVKDHRHNEILFGAVFLTCESQLHSPLVDGTITANFPPRSRRSTTLRICCQDISIKADWNLISVAEEVLAIGQREVVEHQITSTTRSSIDQKTQSQHDIQLVLSNDTCTAAFTTINIKTVLTIEEIATSLAICMSPGKDINVLEAVVASKVVTSYVESHTEVLLESSLSHPNVFLRCVKPTDLGAESRSVNVATNSTGFECRLQQDLPALVELFNLVLIHEIHQLHALSRVFSKRSTQHVKADKSREWNFHVTCLLNRYLITVPLLHCFVYELCGDLARSSIVVRGLANIAFDYDISEHSHDLHATLENESTNIASFKLPAANGRLLSTMKMRMHRNLSAHISMNSVKIDAAAIHGLFVALSRPELTDILRELKEDLKSLKERASNLGVRSHSEHTSAKPSLSYDAHLTISGLSIVARTQRSDHGDEPLLCNLDFGSIQLLVNKGSAHRESASGFPCVYASLPRIHFELDKVRTIHHRPCGELDFGIRLIMDSSQELCNQGLRAYRVTGDDFNLHLSPETAPCVVNIIGHLQQKLKGLDLSREKHYLRKLRKSRGQNTNGLMPGEEAEASSPSIIFASSYSLELKNTGVTWFVGHEGHQSRKDRHIKDLQLSLKRVKLSTQRQNSARLTIQDLLLQMVSGGHDSRDNDWREANSALLPELVFNVGYVSTTSTRRLAFQAAGKALDLRLDSHFLPPAVQIQRSMQEGIEQLRAASASWTPSRQDSGRAAPLFGKKRMESLLVDADFAGAVVTLADRKGANTSPDGLLRRPPAAAMAKYAQYTGSDVAGDTILQAPGLAWKIEYQDNAVDDPSLNAEVKVNASSNILYPAVVPLILEISSTIKEMVRKEDDTTPFSEKDDTSPLKTRTTLVENVADRSDDENILISDPTAVLGRTRLNLGVRICRQEFSLSCQPIARVAAIAKFEDIYLTVNTVQSPEQGHFFAASASVSKLQASVQHVYSRESTGSVDIDSLYLSLMNSKHVSGTSGISAILKISPARMLLNVKQVQDFMLFREIWLPPELRQAEASSLSTSTTARSQILVQRYQQVAATGAFPWNATIAIAGLDLQLDLGQAIGKATFAVSDFWVSSKKTSDWEQNLCLGFQEVGVKSTGRMGGFVALKNFRVRTSIRWPARQKAINTTPLVQGSIAFSSLRAKAAFDYQAFLIANIAAFEFVMHNVRTQPGGKGDRLVAILDGEAVQIFCTTTTASQALALYQAIERLVSEKKASYEVSLREVARFMKRASPSATTLSQSRSTMGPQEKPMASSPISLHTDVIVTLQAINVGAFPSSFADPQIFKLEALNAQARFAAMIEDDRIHSILALTLGQLRIGLAAVKDAVHGSQGVSSATVDEVIANATGSRGGTILKVPKVSATMQTWQRANDTHIDYIFKSAFEGKVEVGWNYSRISFIRSMWASHSKALAQRLGKPLPPSAFKITGVPDDELMGGNVSGQQRKITAEVKVPQSRYNYTAMEPPVIEAPQLRDMGEATPPLEWIGLHRDRLPNLTHQIVIVTLLELAGEVEDAYNKILGSS